MPEPRGAGVPQPGAALPASRVTEALGPPELPGRQAAFTGVTIDSRAVAAGSLFVGIRGPNHDGNAFALDAARGGATGVVAEAPPPEALPEGVSWWRVEDGAAALRRLALRHRRAMSARVVCVTGSNGKTGTKELIAGVLALRFRVHRTRGNLNNQIGLPLSLLELRPDHEWAVLEIGTNQPGEIARLAALALPEIGVITNVAPSHLEGLGTLEGVVREKTDLAAALGRDGTLVYGGDGDLLRSAVQAFSCTKLSFGLSPSNDVHPIAYSLDAEGRPAFTIDGVGEIRLRLAGVANMLNALAAVAVGRVAGVPATEIREGLEAAEPLPLRLQVARVGGVTVVQDCYNANPESVRRGVETLRVIGEPGRRVVVLGGMRELGREAETLHYLLGAELARDPVDLLVAYGEDALPLARGYQSATEAAVFWFVDARALVRFLLDRVRPPAAVLFKASRAAALDEAAREYMQALATHAPTNGGG